MLHPDTIVKPFWPIKSIPQDGHKVWSRITKILPKDSPLEDPMMAILQKTHYKGYEDDADRYYWSESKKFHIIRIAKGKERGVGYLSFLIVPNSKQKP